MSVGNFFLKHSYQRPFIIKRKEHSPTKVETRKVMKLSGIAIAATAVASATAYLTTRLLTREALDRDEPRVFQKAGNLISGTQSGNAFQEELRKAAEKLAQKENETVEITG